MLSEDEVNRVVGEAVSVALKKEWLSRVLSEPTADSEGREALSVTIILTDGADIKIDGDSALDTIVSIQRDLLKAGDQRFAIVDFATEEEMRAGDDPES